MRCRQWSGLLGIAFLLSFSFPVTAQESEARVFDTIEVRGNDRFRDGDILATADLRAGEAYTEDDIVGAVEALEFTGEFRHVRIFSRGQSLHIVVDEEPEYSGRFTFGLGADSDIGVFGSAGIRLDNILGGDKSFSASVTLSEEVATARADFSGDTFWFGRRPGGVRASFADYDYDNALFDSTAATLAPYLEFGTPAAGLTGEIRLTGFWTDVSSVDPFASDIVQADEGNRFVYGPGVSLRWSDPDDDRWQVGLGLDVYGGDASFADASLGFTTRLPIGPRAVLRSRGRLGLVEGLGSDTVTVADRRRLGGSTLRGFARGGITPVDICGGCGAGGQDVTTELGGERYAVLQNDLMIPVFGDTLPFVPGLYFDIGSVWEVDSATPPSGTLVDDRKWRSSAGIALSADTQLGVFSASYALATNAEEFDDTERLTISFISEF